MLDPDAGYRVGYLRPASSIDRAAALTGIGSNADGAAAVPPGRASMFAVGFIEVEAEGTIDDRTWRHRTHVHRDGRDE